MPKVRPRQARSHVCVKMGCNYHLPMRMKPSDKRNAQPTSPVKNRRDCFISTVSTIGNSSAFASSCPSGKRHQSTNALEPSTRHFMHNPMRSRLLRLKYPHDLPHSDRHAARSPRHPASMISKASPREWTKTCCTCTNTHTRSRNLLTTPCK